MDLHYCFVLYVLVVLFSLQFTQLSFLCSYSSFVRMSTFMNSLVRVRLEHTTYSYHVVFELVCFVECVRMFFGDELLVLLKT